MGFDSVPAKPRLQTPFDPSPPPLPTRIQEQVNRLPVDGGARENRPRDRILGGAGCSLPRPEAGDMGLAFPL